MATMKAMTATEPITIPAMAPAPSPLEVVDASGLTEVWLSLVLPVREALAAADIVEVGVLEVGLEEDAVVKVVDEEVEVALVVELVVCTVTAKSSVENGTGSARDGIRQG